MRRIRVWKRTIGFAKLVLFMFLYNERGVTNIARKGPKFP
jgi:hypothetical protein